jgi:hypothetical protein
MPGYDAGRFISKSLEDPREQCLNRRAISILLLFFAE